MMHRYWSPVPVTGWKLVAVAEDGKTWVSPWIAALNQVQDRWARASHYLGEPCGGYPMCQMCGWYAWKWDRTPSPVELYSYHAIASVFVGYVPAVAVVALAGTVVEHEHGWRGEWMRFLEPPTRFPVSSRDLPENSDWFLDLLQSKSGILPGPASLPSRTRPGPSQGGEGPGAAVEATT